MHDLLSVDAQRSEQVHFLRYYGSERVVSYESPVSTTDEKTDTLVSLDGIRMLFCLRDINWFLSFND